LAGARGDAINAILVAPAINIRLLLAWLRLLLPLILATTTSAITTQTTRSRLLAASPETETHSSRTTRYINDRVKAALDAGEPAISVDTKKKELVGDFKNAAASGRQKVRLKKCVCTISSFQNWDALHLWRL